MTACAATFVTKSPSVPLSVEMSIAERMVVGAAVSSVYAWLDTGPSLPARSVTFSSMLLAPERVAPVQLTAVPDTEPVTSAQVAPPSTEPRSRSPAASGALSAPVIVCAATFVTKSPSTPVSAEMSSPETPVVGAAASTV